MRTSSWFAGVALAGVCVAGACGGDERSSRSDDDDTGDTTSGPGAGGSGAQGGGPGAGGAVASSSASATGGAGGTGGAAGCVGLGDPCTDCEAASCNAVYCTCFDNPACGQLGACLDACPAGDQDCAEGCLTQHQDGISDGALLVHCAATSCAAACPGYTPLDACQQCLFTSCEPQMNTCLGNPDCADLLECLGGCNGDSNCENGCYFQHGGGIGDATPVGDCLNASCQAQCQ